MKKITSENGNEYAVKKISAFDMMEAGALPKAYVVESAGGEKLTIAGKLEKDIQSRTVRLGQTEDTDEIIGIVDEIGKLADTLEKIQTKEAKAQKTLTETIIHRGVEGDPDIAPVDLDFLVREIMTYSGLMVSEDENKKKSETKTT